MARVLIYDIENMGVLGWAWGLYEQNLIHIEHPQHLLSIAYKWLGEKKVHIISLPDFDLYETEPHNDRALAEAFWPVVDSADVVVGHNSIQFDDKMVNSMFMRHKMKPPSPYKQVDTKRAAKSAGRFISNKLDDLGEEFGIGKKMKHQGFPLWLGCDAGDMKAWKTMCKYNVQDVKLTELLYLELRPWVKNHPSMNVLKKEWSACPKCGKNDMRPGLKYHSTKTGLYQYFRCASCGGVAKSRKVQPNEKPEFSA